MICFQPVQTPITYPPKHRVKDIKLVAPGVQPWLDSLPLLHTLLTNTNASQTR